MNIATKADFYDASYRLALGNTIRQWEYDEFMPLYHRWVEGGLKLPDIVAVRIKTPNSPLMRYHLTPPQAMHYMEKLHSDYGIPYSMMQLSEHAPDHLITIQGEVYRPDGSYLYTRVNTTRRYQYLDPDERARQCRMRLSLGAPDVKHLWGLEAHLVLKGHMDGPSWDCLQELLTLYPDAVIEFGCYELPVGVLGWNTIFWEVRNY